MKATRKKVLFVDWHKTLCDDLFWQSLPPAEFDRAQEAMLHKLNPSTLEVWMVGGHASEEICRRIGAASGIPERRLFDTLVTDCRRMRVDPASAVLLKQLRRHYHVALVTDNMDCFTRFTVKAAGLRELFDDIVNSADIGRIKADDNLRTLKDLAARHDVPLSDCVLVDDSQLHCSMFKEHGGTAYRPTSPANAAVLLANLSLQTRPNTQTGD